MTKDDGQLLAVAAGVILGEAWVTRVSATHMTWNDDGIRFIYHFEIRCDRRFQPVMGYPTVDEALDVCVGLVRQIVARDLPDAPAREINERAITLLAERLR